jgi:hypothetical protein
MEIKEGEKLKTQVVVERVLEQRVKHIESGSKSFS